MLPEEPLRTLRYWFDVEALAAFAPAFASLRGPKGITFETYQKTMEEAFQRACEATAEAEHQVDDDFSSPP
jgi:hypothetical protein